MRKTKILAFALAVIMVFSVVSVSAFAAPSYDDIKNSVGEGNVIYYTDFEGMTLTRPTELKEQITLTKGGLTEKYNANYYNYVSVFDQYGTETGGKNITTDGHGLIYSEWADYFDRTTECPSGNGNDNNNCYDIQLDDVNTLRGKDIVFTTSFTMLSDAIKGSVNWTVYCNHAKTQIGVTPISIASGVLRMGDKDILKLSKGMTVDLAYAIKIVAPTEPGTYNAADFDGENKLSLADF